MTDARPTACILCECNCGIEVRLGGDSGRRFERIRGDRRHPTSQGYACEKAHRLDYYQNGRDRLTQPMRRRADGSFEPVDWETAFTEIARRLAAVRDRDGGESIFYYGGGGQGNHLGGAYAGATLAALGALYRSNALAQEKTGEFWVSGRMLGAPTRGDFEHAEVAIFLGKNPWHSHGIARARVTLREIAKDPERTMIVIDPRRSETADLADVHLAVRPGTDAWLVAALLGVLVQEDRIAHDWLAEHADGLDAVLPLLREVPVGEYAERCGIPEETVRQVARRIAEAESVAIYEDLGIQMNHHSTLVSYLERLVWLLTGNLAKRGGHYVPNVFYPLARFDARTPKRSPVVGARIISKLVPANVIADEILTDHPDRYRAMIVESANPAHSLAGSERMREALRALDTLVVIDVAMTETARLADFVLPVPTQYEKHEATFFNFEFPRNAFHLRRPLLEPPEGVLPEPEIHARLVESLGAMPEGAVERLRAALEQGREAFQMAFVMEAQQDAAFRPLAPVVLYRTLGPTLPDGAASAAVLWAAAHQYAMRAPEAARRAGIEGEGPDLGENLFEAILSSPSGVVFSAEEADGSWERIRTAGGRVQLAIPELFDELRGLREERAPRAPEAFPFVLSAGERRSFTANTIFRDPDWRRKDAEGTLRIHPADAAELGLADGERARLTTKRAAVDVPIEISDRMQRGHVSLPNGMGVDYPEAEGDDRAAAGVAPNELTDTADRDWLAGTPWHKFTPARIERVS